VTQTAVIYAVAGLAVIEFADVVFPLFGIGEGIERVVILLVLAGFPAALVIAWWFELGPDGIRRRPKATGLLPFAAGTLALALLAMGLAGLALRGRIVGNGVRSVAGTEPAVTISAPPAWAHRADSAVFIPRDGQLPFRGLVRHAVPIREVLLNGRRLRLDRGEGGAVAFEGIIRPDDARYGDVAVVLRASDGGVHFVSYPARVQGVESEVVGPVTAAPEPAAGEIGPESRSVRPADRARHAVIVGISEYADPTLPAPQFAAEDARAFYAFLRSPAAGMGGVPEDHIRLLVNEDATGANIRGALRRLREGSAPEDVFFVFVAAQGVEDPDDSANLYLLAHDADPRDLKGTAVNAYWINDAIQDARAYQKILFTDMAQATQPAAASEPVARPEAELDAAGRAAGRAARGWKPSVINQAFLDYMANSSGGFVAFTSAEAGQYSWEGEQWGGGHGAFTYHLLRGLEGEADAPELGGDGDRIVTLGEVMEYTRDQVRRETRNAQIPTLSLTPYDRFWPMAAVIDNPTGG
jgi:hypothetical protein